MKKRAYSSAKIGRIRCSEVAMKIARRCTLRATMRAAFAISRVISRGRMNALNTI